MGEVFLISLIGYLFKGDLKKKPTDPNKNSTKRTLRPSRFNMVKMIFSEIKLLSSTFLVAVPLHV